MKIKSVKINDVLNLVRPAVRGLAAYHIDETPVRVKLDAMENPFLLPEKIRREIGKKTAQAHINRYPDPSAKKLKQAIARAWKMDTEQMLLGNGSDELIQAIIMAFGGPVLTPAPSFVMYDISARALSAPAGPAGRRPLCPPSRVSDGTSIPSSGYGVAFRAGA